MRKLLQFVTLCACLLLHTSLVAQTYTFDNGGGDGLWSNAANWDPVPPSSPLNAGSIIIASNCTQDINFIIQSGASLTINAGAVLTRSSNTLSIRGTMTINGTLINNTTLTITSTGTLINNGTIDNGDSALDFISNNGTIENNGIINILAGRLNNQGTGIIHNNAPNGSITISMGAELRNQNQMDNAGLITNNGTFNAALSTGDLFTNTGMITNNGALNIAETFDNNGTILNTNTITVSGSGTLNNNASGTITNTFSGTFTNNNIVNNIGIFNNDGTLLAANGSGDSFNNSGILNNTLNLDIGQGTLNNTITGTINNNTGGTLTVGNNGTLINAGTLNNNSLVTNNNNIHNTGTFNNNVGGVLNNGNHPSDLFDNDGIVHNDGMITNNAEITSDMPFPTSGSGTFNNVSGNLPIDLLYFIGKAQENTVLLKWETASEKENAYIAVERSKDGIHFQEIGRRKGAGTTSLQQYYDFTDTTPFFGLNYYRLRQVDTDEKATYHNIIAVEFGGKAKEGIQLFPTQASQDITITLSAPPATNSTLQIWDTSGKLLRQQTWNAESIQETINITSLAAGTYFVTFQDGNSVQTLRFMRL